MKILLVLLSLFLMVSPAMSATYYASSTGSGTTCSQASPCAFKYTVETKASAGDTVMVTAGAYTHDATVTIDKALTVTGAGIASTTFNVSATPAITISPASDVAVKITGINFDSSAYLADNSKTIFIDNNTAGAFSNIVIGNNKFTKSHDAIYTSGWVYGLAYLNTFLNCEIGVRVTGDDTAAWGRDIEAGTANSFYIEGNTFTYTSDFPAAFGGPEQSIYHQQGGRSVTRYNTVDATAYEANFSFYDSHGNWGTPITTYRGQPIVEVYNNSVAVYSSTCFMDIRGGSSLIYNNAFTYASGSAPIAVRFWEEEEWSTGGPWSGVPQDTEWPATDQIFNTFVYSNTLNGAAAGISIHSNNTTEFFTENQDYWLATPASSGGKTTWTGDAGLAASHSFSGEGANAYYPYTRYTCPHPLVGSGSCDSTVKGTTGYTVTGLGTTFAPWVH